MKNKDTEKENSEVIVPQPEFKGYNMAELRYQLAILSVKKEFMKEKAIGQTEKIRKSIPVINGKSPISAISAHGIVGKLVKGLNFTDYILLGIQALMIGKKITSIFRRGKK